MKKYIIFLLLVVLMSSNIHAQMRELNTYNLSATLGGIFLKSDFGNYNKNNTTPTRVIFTLNPNSTYKLGLQSAGDSVKFVVDFGNRQNITIQGNIEIITIETGDEKQELILEIYPTSESRKYKAGYCYTLNYFGSKH